jgi:L-rhamnose mutarotase
LTDRPRPSILGANREHEESQVDQVGQMWRAKPGKAEEYRRVHATVWPEVEQLLRDAGVSKYAIYAWGDVFFSHMEVQDYAAMVERFNGDPVAQRWEEELGDLIEYPDSDPGTGWPLILDDVWSLAPGGE